MWERWCGPEERLEGLVQWFRLCYTSSWGRVAGPLGSLQNPGSSWTWRNGPESLPQVIEPLRVSLVPWVPLQYSSSGWRIPIHWLVCSNSTDVFWFAISKLLMSLLLVLTTSFFLTWLHFLTINRLLAWFGYLFPWAHKSHSRFILFCGTGGWWYFTYSNKSLVKVCPLLLKQKFG